MSHWLAMIRTNTRPTHLPMTTFNKKNCNIIGPTLRRMLQTPFEGIALACSAGDMRSKARMCRLIIYGK